MSIINEAAELKDYLIKIRRGLHQMPEIALKLPKTVAYVAAELDKLNVDYEIKEDISCIFAMIGKNDGRKCILLRADMDGLAINEKSGEPFACTTGTMHACGHDMHATSLLGAAKLLKAHEDELDCCVKLLFQSAEETFEGAKAAIEAGVLKDPKPAAAYGSHVFAMSPAGSVSYGQTPMGAVYGFKITVHGVGGHGSTPEICIDPINAAVQIYLALQAIISREVPAVGQAVLTIGQLTAGTAANIIPDTAVLQGTLRTFDSDLRSYIIKRINAVYPAVANTYRCTAELEVLSDVPSVKCDPEFSAYCMDVMKQEGLAEEYLDMHVMGSEDFAFLSEKVPACFFAIGACPDDMEVGLGQHHPAIRFNEDVMVKVAAAYAAMALNFK